MSSEQQHTNDPSNGNSNGLLQTQIPSFKDDDELEEFEVEDWKEIPLVADEELYEADWDLEPYEDAFLTHLRAELTKDEASI